MQEYLKNQTEDENSSLADKRKLLKTIGGNIVKSTLICLLVGASNYFSEPNIFEATATIEMATIARQSVEQPDVFMEKIKLPLYFSSEVLQACGRDSELSSSGKFVDTIKPFLNKSAQYVTFSTQAQSAKEAKACLNLVIAEITSNQDAIAKNVIEIKKQKLNLLNDQIKLAEENLKIIKTQFGINKQLGYQTPGLILGLIFINEMAADIHNLRSAISDLEIALSAPQTHSVKVVSQIYAEAAPVNKRPFFTLGLYLALGVFCGLLLTWVMRVVPEIWKLIGKGSEI